jgi:hypothetical protein
MTIHSPTKESFFLKQRQELCRSIKTKEYYVCTRRLARLDTKKAPEGLTIPRNATEHKHDTLPWVIVAERGSQAASSSDFPWQATH